jgi:lipooligosaccharide transport system ATP-binding protein
MEEAQRLCDRLVIMDQGKILTEGSPEELVEKYVGKEVLELHAPAATLEKLAQKARQLPAGSSAIETETVGDTLYLIWREKEANPLRHLPEIQDMDFHLRPATLEDVFLKLAGRELRE